MAEEMPRIDAHHHVWDLRVRPQSWLDPEEMAPIRTTFTVDDLRPAAHAAGMGATVLVQTVPSEEETREFLAIADADPLIAAVTGWVDLTAPDVADRLAALLEAPGGPYLRAIRHGVQDEPDPSWLRRPEVQRGIQAVGAAGLAYELLIKPPQLPAALDVAHALSEVRFVLDHCGKPSIAEDFADTGDAFRVWRDAMYDLADADNVVCKVSGLVTEARWDSWSASHLAPYVDVVMQSFTAQRAMFGSDWPVCLLATSYPDWVETVEVCCEGLSRSELRSLFAGTAATTYRIDLPET